MERKISNLERENERKEKITSERDSRPRKEKRREN
jgi:hypothetical protein